MNRRDLLKTILATPIGYALLKIGAAFDVGFDGEPPDGLKPSAPRTRPSSLTITQGDTVAVFEIRQIDVRQEPQEIDLTDDATDLDATTFSPAPPTSISACVEGFESEGIDPGRAAFEVEAGGFRYSFDGGIRRVTRFPGCEEDLSHTVFEIAAIGWVHTEVVT